MKRERYVGESVSQMRRDCPQGCSDLRTALEREQTELFKKRLLQKRRTYVQYFERSLGEVDAALRRIALRRESRLERVVVEYGARLSAIKTGAYTTYAHDVNSYQTRVVIPPLPEGLGEKEKQKLKKYLSRQRVRLFRQRPRSERRAERSAFYAQKAKEARLASGIPRRSNAQRKRDRASRAEKRNQENLAAQGGAKAVQQRVLDSRGALARRVAAGGSSLRAQRRRRDQEEEDNGPIILT